MDNNSNKTNYLLLLQLIYHKKKKGLTYDIGNTGLCLCVDKKKRLSGYT